MKGKATGMVRFCIRVTRVVADRDVDVYLVSGGFRQMINPLAEVLNIDKSRIYANNLLFDDDGNYAGMQSLGLCLKLDVLRCYVKGSMRKSQRVELGGKLLLWAT